MKTFRGSVSYRKRRLIKTQELIKAQLWGYIPNIAVGFGCAALAFIPAVP